MAAATYKIWMFWAALFDWMPYGDPYGALAAMFVLIVIVARRLSRTTPAY